jgi:hypothetical protein
MRTTILVLSALSLLTFTGCHSQTSDDIQRDQQERILKEATSQVGMPAIKNFRERKMLKDILELRDQDGLVTYTYIFSDFNGKFVFVGETIGYGIPYATQYTNPQKAEWYQSGGRVVLPQADPNGLFSPQSAEGTWILMKDPNGTAVKPVYIESRIQAFPFKLPAHMVMHSDAAPTLPRKQ